TADDSSACAHTHIHCGVPLVVAGKRYDPTRGISTDSARRARGGPDSASPVPALILRSGGIVSRYAPVALSQTFTQICAVDRSPDLALQFPDLLTLYSQPPALYVVDGGGFRPGLPHPGVPAAPNRTGSRDHFHRVQHQLHVDSERPGIRKPRRADNRTARLVEVSSAGSNPAGTISIRKLRYFERRIQSRTRLDARSHSRQRATGVMPRLCDSSLGRWIQKVHGDLERISCIKRATNSPDLYAQVVAGLRGWRTRCQAGAAGDTRLTEIVRAATVSECPHIPLRRFIKR